MDKFLTRRLCSSYFFSFLAFLFSISMPAAMAIQLANGKVYFAHPPRLVSATTTFKETNVWSSRYYFTVEIPADAGEALQTVNIVQTQGADQIRFNLKETRAFSGKSAKRGEKLTLQSVTGDPDTGIISVNFDPSVAAGTTVTIELHPYENPRYSGVYLFGVTAFPAGEQPQGQFLGYGRLHFYSPSDSL